MGPPRWSVTKSPKANMGRPISRFRARPSPPLCHAFVDHDDGLDDGLAVVLILTGRDVKITVGWPVE